MEEILEGNGVIVVLAGDTEDLAGEDGALADALLGRRRSGGASTTVTGDGGRRGGRGRADGDRTDNGEELNGNVDGLRALLNNHLEGTNTGEVATGGEGGERQLVLVGGLASGEGDVTRADGAGRTRVDSEGHDGGQIRENSGTEVGVAASGEVTGIETVGLEVEGSISSVPLHGGVTLSTIGGGALEVSVGDTSGHEQVRVTRNDNQLKITFVTNDGTISGGGEGGLSNGVHGVVLSGDDDLTGDGGELIDDDVILESRRLSESTSHEKEAKEKGRSHRRQGEKIKKPRTLR